MTPHCLDLIRNASWHLRMEGPVLEIGSYIEDNQEGLDLRQAVPRSTLYGGADVIAGPGVDVTMDLTSEASVRAAVDQMAPPRVILCLYVLEHVWDIRAATQQLAKLWRSAPEAWLWAATHQMQPYHGTAKYPDYWRVTHTALARLFAEAGIEGGHILVNPDSSNPEDVMFVRQPASQPWPEEAMRKVLALSRGHWEQVS